MKASRKRLKYVVAAVLVFGTAAAISALYQFSLSPPADTSLPDMSPPYTSPPFASPPMGWPPNGPPPAAPPTPSSTWLVEDLVSSLDWGNISFSAPPAMRYKRPTLVELLLSPSLSATALEDRLRNRSNAESAEIQVSNRMEARLTGRGFAIEDRTPELQAVTTTAVTRWAWEVTPFEHGTRILHLSLSAHIVVENHDAPFVVRTFEREITVQITISQQISGFVQNNWEWLWAAVLVPVAGWLWRRRKHNQATEGAEQSRF